MRFYLFFFLCPFYFFNDLMEHLTAKTTILIISIMKMIVIIMVSYSTCINMFKTRIEKDEILQTLGCLKQ